MDWQARCQSGLNHNCAGSAYERVHRAKPYLIKPKELPPGMTEHRIYPQELARYEEATRCINCFCCAEACISGNRNFIGPNAAMASIVRMMDPREEEKNERLNLLYSEEGIYRCHTSKACSHVCPKEIDVAHFSCAVQGGSFFMEGQMMPGEILSGRLARYFCGVTFNDLNADHVEKMKAFLLDWLGSAYAGKDLPPIQMMRKVARRLGGTPEAKSIPDGIKTNCLLASLVNGASSHIVEMDDLPRESILHQCGNKTN